MYLYDAAATASPNFAPTNLISTDSVDSKAEWYDNTEFKSVLSLGFSALSFIFGWVFREKIAYHILSNWGYDYVLMYSDDDAILKPDKIGFILSTSIKNHNDQDIPLLFCKKRISIIK